MEGASCLEPLELLVLGSSLAARPIEGITKNVSDWKPVLKPVQDSTRVFPDCSVFFFKTVSGSLPVDPAIHNGLSVRPPILTETAVALAVLNE